MRLEICDGISSLTIPSLENISSCFLQSYGPTKAELMFNSSSIVVKICNKAVVNNKSVSASQLINVNYMI